MCNSSEFEYPDANVRSQTSPEPSRTNYGYRDERQHSIDGVALFHEQFSTFLPSYPKTFSVDDNADTTSSIEQYRTQRLSHLAQPTHPPNHETSPSPFQTDSLHHQLHYPPTTSYNTYSYPRYTGVQHFACHEQRVQEVPTPQVHYHSGNGDSPNIRLDSTLVSEIRKDEPSGRAFTDSSWSQQTKWLPAGDWISTKAQGWSKVILSWCPCRNSIFQAGGHSFSLYFMTKQSPKAPAILPIRPLQSFSFHGIVRNFRAKKFVFRYKSWGHESFSPFDSVF